jgi:hypothetical protein
MPLGNGRKFQEKNLSEVNLGCMKRGSGCLKHRNYGLRYNAMQFGIPVPAGCTFSTGVPMYKGSHPDSCNLQEEMN